MKILSNLLWFFSAFLLLVIVALNNAATITVGKTVSHIMTYALCLLVIGAMLCRTLKNREHNASRTGYGMKLTFLVILFLSATVSFLLELVRG